MNSIRLNKNQYLQLLNELKKDGITPENFPGNISHELIRFKQNDRYLVVYKKKSVIWNPDSIFDELIDKIILEKGEEQYKNFEFIIGSDEVGKGEWFGPLITVATCIKTNYIPRFQRIGIRDSKSLSKENIFSLFNKANELEFKRHSVTINPKRLNELWKKFIEENRNYNDLIAWEHQRAILDLLEKIDNSKKILIIIDKFDVDKINSRLKNLYQKNNIQIIQKSQAESEIPVALASIIAKKIWYEEIEKINYNFNLTLPKTHLEDVDPDIVYQIGKLFFKNVRKVINLYFLEKNLKNLLDLIDLGEINPFDDHVKTLVQNIFKSNEKIQSYLKAAFKFDLEPSKIDKDKNNSKEFIKIIENEKEYKKEIEEVKEKDPDAFIIEFIIHQLKQEIDEIDIIDFKYCLKNKDKIAKTISAFCNGYLLTREKSYIVFGVIDKKSMPKDFSFEERIIPLQKMLSESKLNTSEQFQYEINKIVERHLNPCPDSCYTIKSLNFKGYGPFTEEIKIIIIHIKSFNLESPIYFQKKIYIRKNGQDREASPDEIVQLTKKIDRHLY